MNRVYVCRGCSSYFCNFSTMCILQTLCTYFIFTYISIDFICTISVYNLLTSDELFD